MAILNIEIDLEQRQIEDKRFTVWMKRVDVALLRRCGLTSEDLPDIYYRGMFDGGVSPASAVNAVIENDGFTN